MHNLIFFKKIWNFLNIYNNNKNAFIIDKPSNAHQQSEKSITLKLFLSLIQVYTLTGSGGFKSIANEKFDILINFFLSTNIWESHNFDNTSLVTWNQINNSNYLIYHLVDWIHLYFFDLYSGVVQNDSHLKFLLPFNVHHNNQQQQQKSISIWNFQSIIMFTEQCGLVNPSH